MNAYDLQISSFGGVGGKDKSENDFKKFVEDKN